METLKNFLHPKRKENIRFVLSDSFVNEQGNPLEWEMRQIKAKEGMEISRDCEGAPEMETMARYIAEALVVPNLKSAEIVDAMAQEHNGKIMSPSEILLELVTDGELAKLVRIYNQHNQASLDFHTLKEEAKN